MSVASKLTTFSLTVSESDLRYNFDKDQNWQYVGVGYNYESIMHFDSYAFSKNWGILKTIVPKLESVSLTDPQEKNEMAKSDADQVNSLYFNECQLRNTQ